MFKLLILHIQWRVEILLYSFIFLVNIGLYLYLGSYDQEYIKEQVADLYMWPKSLDIPILDDSRY